MNYCPICGSRIAFQTVELEGDIPYCAQCGKLFFPHNACCVIMLVNLDGQLLVIKQGYVNDSYCLVAGHVKASQTVEDTLIAELKEEVNLRLLSAQYVGSYYHAKSNHLMLGFYVEAEGEIKINSEVDDFYLVDVQQATKMLAKASTARCLLDDAIKKGLI